MMRKGAAMSVASPRVTETARFISIDLPHQALAAGRTTLTEPESKTLLDAYGLATPPRQCITGTQLPAQLTVPPPWTLKIVSPQVLHKSDSGGVKLGLTKREQPTAAMAALADTPALSGFLLEAMAPRGQEFVIGGRHHPRFGPMVDGGIGKDFRRSLRQHCRAHLSDC